MLTNTAQIAPGVYQGITEGGKIITVAVDPSPVVVPVPPTHNLYPGLPRRVTSETFTGLVVYMVREGKEDEDTAALRALDADG